MRIIIILFILVTVNLIKSINIDDINYSFINSGAYTEWGEGLDTNPTRHVRFIDSYKCKTNTLSSTDTLDCLFKKLPELVKKDEYKYLLEYDGADYFIYGEEVLQTEWSSQSASDPLLIIFKDVVEYNKFINVLNNQYLLLTVQRKDPREQMELTLQVVKQNGDDTVYKLIKAEMS